jgi:phospholipid/cholesterol/gamma-HCH transport system ATP-binding protein
MSLLPYIQLRNVWKSFDNQLVLAGVSLDIHKGETLGILGKSGTGKSVTLKLISGLLEPDKGEILINGVNIVGKKEDELLQIRKKVSYVFQQGALFDSLTLYENIAFPLYENEKYSFEEVNERVIELAKMLEVYEYIDKYPADVTLGVKKRVAIARAFATDPEAVLYDEPTTGLDPLMAKKISQLIRKLNQNNKLTSVVVTHDISCIETVSDKIALLNEGEILFYGTVDELKNSDEPFIKEFLYGMNAFEPEYIGE